MSDAWGRVYRDEVEVDALGLTDGESRLYALMCTYADRDGWLTRKQGDLAEQLGVRREAINRRMKRLVDAGAVEAVPRPGMKRSLRYRIAAIANRVESADALRTRRVEAKRTGQGDLFDEVGAQAAQRSISESVPLDVERTSCCAPKRTSVVRAGAHHKKQTPVKQAAAAQARAPDLSDPPFAPPPDLRSGEFDEEAKRSSPIINPSGLAERLFEAAGDAIDPHASGIAIIHAPMRWLQEGFDLEGEVLPIIAAVSVRQRQRDGPRIASWTYFEPALREARRTANRPRRARHERSNSTGNQTGRSAFGDAVARLTGG